MSTREYCLVAIANGHHLSALTLIRLKFSMVVTVPGPLEYLFHATLRF